MIFHIQKGISYLLHPFVVVGLLLLIASLRIVWQKYQAHKQKTPYQLKWHELSVVGATLLLWGLSFWPITYGLGYFVESGYPAPTIPQGQAMVIVLGGGMRGQGQEPGWPVQLGNSSLRRATAAIKMARANPQITLLFSGGKLDKQQGKTEAQAMAELAQELGVAPEQLLTENRSRNTRENALYSIQLLEKQQLQQQTLFLLTSRRHLWRATAVFRNLGVTPAPIPSDIGLELVGITQRPWKGYFSLNNLKNSCQFLREIVGYTYYWLRGWV